MEPSLPATSSAPGLSGPLEAVLDMVLAGLSEEADGGRRDPDAVAALHALLAVSLSSRRLHALVMPHLMRSLFLLSASRFDAAALRALLADGGFSPDRLALVREITASLGGEGHEDEDDVEVLEPLQIQVLRRVKDNLRELHLYALDDQIMRLVLFLAELGSFTGMRKLRITFQGSKFPISLAGLRLPPNLEEFAVNCFLRGHALQMDFEPLYAQIDGLSDLRSWSLGSAGVHHHVQALLEHPRAISLISGVADVIPLRPLLRRPEFRPTRMSFDASRAPDSLFAALAAVDSVRHLRIDNPCANKLPLGLPPNLRSLTLFRPHCAVPHGPARARLRAMLRTRRKDAVAVVLIGHQGFDMAEGRFWYEMGRDVEWWWPVPH